MPDYSAEIAELEEIVNSSVDQTAVDGTSTKVNLEHARKRLAELRALDPDSIQAGRVRPRAMRIRLDSF
jgi:hypothetical protein